VREAAVTTAGETSLAAIFSGVCNGKNRNDNDMGIKWFFKSPDWIYGCINATGFKNIMQC
jgi:hypothetical protein